jgi:hypothetical protein
MKRALSTMAVFGGIVFFASDASAIEFGTRSQEHPYRSAQNFALELRFSPYRPQIDDEFEGQGITPFRDSFGSSARLYIGLEFDWQTFRIPYIGTIGPGLGVGLVSMSRSATTVTGRPSGDDYTLAIYPFHLVGVLRADTFWRDLGFPIVPYGKLGVGYAFWRATSADVTSTTGGVSGKGSSFGPHIAIGAAFALDVFDKGASRNMDNATGINNTYLYFEYYSAMLNSSLAQENALRVGTATWAMGLAFEF